MPIQINQTNAVLGIKTQNANIQIRNNGPRNITISHSDPRIEMHTTQPKVLIDQYQCFADAGLKNSIDFISENAQLGAQQAYQYTAMKAQEGDALAKIENGGKPLIDIIKQERENPIDYNIGTVPTHRPEIMPILGQVDMQVIMGEVSVDYNKEELDVRYNPSNIQFYMIQNNSINIQYVGSKVDTKA